MKRRTEVTVTATSMCHDVALCSHEMCAERRLLARAIARVARHRRPTRHSVCSSLGGGMCVERLRADGTLECSKPCLGCQMALSAFDVRLWYTDHDGNACRVRSRDLVDGMVTVADRKRWG